MVEFCNFLTNGSKTTLMEGKENKEFQKMSRRLLWYTRVLTVTASFLLFLINFKNSKLREWIDACIYFISIVVSAHFFVFVYILIMPYALSIYLIAATFDPMIEMIDNQTIWYKAKRNLIQRKRQAISNTRLFLQVQYTKIRSERKKFKRLRYEKRIKG